MGRLVIALVGFALPGVLALAEGTVVSASSVHPGPYRPEYGIDGDRGTRWASVAGRAEPEWLQIDFGRSVAVTALEIHWERAHAVDYEVQMSVDGRDWTAIVSTSDGKGGKERFDGLSGKGRYLRVFCTRAGQHRLYSIWELVLVDAPAVVALARQREAQAAAQREAAAQRRQRLADALTTNGVSEVVFAARESGVDGHWYANFGYYAEDAGRKCYRAGGRLCKLDIASGDLTLLIDDPEGSVRDPALHYDAERVLFSWRRSGTEQFHLYEIGLDGSGLRQLTDGQYDDIEPTYLPDGGIMFISSRCKRWVNCWLTQVGVLYRCEGDGGNIRQLSANVEHDNTPWVLPDGRVLYQRWEYVDRSQVHYHHLWTSNPDGTGQMVYFGNMHPGGVFIDAKPVPGTGDIILINSPGHGRREHAGHVALLSVKSGPDRRPAMRNISGAGFRDPYAVSADVFLAANGRGMWLLGPVGEPVEVYSLPASLPRCELHEPRPVVARPREQVIVPRVRSEDANGRLVLADVNIGRNMAGVKPGEIRKLLVLESLPKPINYTGGMEPLSYGGTFTLERVLGTVPVEPDGSAHMELPANRALFFVALDENERSVKRMQSFLTLMPGETVGCVGCHESRVVAPGNASGAGRVQAVTRAASTPTPVPGIPEVFDYPRDIQPILDRHCVRCHRPENRKGGMLLTRDRGPMFSHSYFCLTANGQIADGRNRAKSNYAPRQIGDSASALMRKVDGTHHGVRVSARDRRLLQYWINTGAAWIGTYAGLGTGMVGGYARNRIDRQDLKWPSVKAAREVMKKRCLECHGQRRPLPLSPSDNMGMPPWSIRYGHPKLRFSRHILYNLTDPTKSALVLAPLSRKAGGWGMQQRDARGKAAGEPIHVFADRTDPDYLTLVAAIEDTKAHLERIKRFDMPGFTPRPEYVREMKRYGVLPASFDLANAPLDVYETDRKYWESLWYKPRVSPEGRGTRPGTPR